MVKFTVVIPTRERPDTLVHTLRTVVMQDYEDLIILVSDNFSQDNTKQVVDSFHDPRIKYINTGKRINMAHNFEFALNHIKDGWVTILGDDDALLPGALTAVAEIIKKTGCQAIRTGLCVYNWPGTLETGEILRVPLEKGMEWRNARVEMGRLMRGKADCAELPILYLSGFVNSQVIDKARSVDGVFYHSAGIDTYSQLAIASVLDRYILLKEPTTIAGISSHSAGGAHGGFTKTQAPLQKAALEGEIPFDKRLECKEIYSHAPVSGQITIYERYLQTEYLHHDSLEIKMDDQLGLALARISRDEYDRFRKYCVVIAARNGLDMVTIDSKEKKYRRGEFFRYWGNRISCGFQYLLLNGRECGIQDVYGASMVAKAVVLMETRYTGWRVKKFFRNVKSFFRIIFGKNS